MRAPTPYEVLLHAAMVGESTRFTRQDSVEEAWRVMQPLLDAPPPVQPYEKGSWGPAAADQLVAGSRRLARARGWRRETGQSKARQPQSAAAPSPFPPIADYAFLSNCHTSALVAPDGSIDWLCVPRFDSPSVFGNLLDRQAGAFRLGPFGINHPDGARLRARDEHRSRRPGRRRPAGSLVRDALTMGPRHGEDAITPHTRPPADDDADHMLVRTVLCLDGQRRGRADLRAGLRLRPHAGASGRWSARTATPPTPAAPSSTIGCRPTWRSASRATGCAPGTHCEQGEQAYCALSWAEGLGRPEDVDEANERMAATARFWRHWLGRARMPDHRWRDPIQRSALAIKGLTYMPTGATVAALTTSLPETPGGERNWDYRFTWIRDSTFTLQALHFLNLDWEADEFMQFVADLEPNEDGALQIMYGIDGRRDLTESTRDDLSGYAGARPVRLGNGAFDQRQNDVFGAALDSILLHTRRSQRLPRRLWPIVQAQAKCATAVWREPDQGIWEARGEPQHYVSSKLMCWVALDRASKLAEIRGDPSSQQTWAATAEEIKADILEHGVTRRRAAPALRDRRARRLDPAGGALRLPARRRRAPAHERARRSPTT